MRRMVMLLIILLGAMLQPLFPAWSLFAGIRPPIVISLIFYYSLRCEKRDMWLAVFWAALLYDAMEPGPFGPGLLVFPLAGWLTHKVRNEVFADGFITQLIFGAIGSGTILWLTCMVYTVSGARPVPFGTCFLRFMGIMILGIVTMPAVSATVKYAESGIPKRREIRWK